MKKKILQGQYYEEFEKYSFVLRPAEALLRGGRFILMCNLHLRD
jgi:hypothetical protein